MRQHRSRPVRRSDAYSPTPKPLTIRYALILLLALITAVTAGFLLYLATHSVALSILTAGGAFAASWHFYDDIIA